MTKFKPSAFRRGGATPRGFAAMDKDRQREIARMGGAAVKAEDRSFSKDRALAAEAGRKGGEASAGERPTAGEDR